MTTEKFEIKKRWSGEVIFTASIDCAPDALPGIKLGLAVKVAVIARANLADANLAGANLARANLAGANLAGANLARANLAGANLADANLADANLARANLAGANLARANLAGANLADANLADANLARANLAGANLADANLADAKLPEETLRTFKADLFLTLSSLVSGPLDALHLIGKLRAGAVDGSTYGGRNDCACLVGTLAQPRGVSGESLDHNAERPAERWFMMIRPGDTPGKLADGKETGAGFAARKALEWVADWCRSHGIDPDQPVSAPVEQSA